jgi:hypothetical protein
VTWRKRERSGAQAGKDPSQASACKQRTRKHGTQRTHRICRHHRHDLAALEARARGWSEAQRFAKDGRHHRAARSEAGAEAEVEVLRNAQRLRDGGARQYRHVKASAARGRQRRSPSRRRRVRV